MLHTKHNRLTLNCECVTCIEKKLRRQSRKMSRQTSNVSQTEQNSCQSALLATRKEEKEAIIVKQEPMDVIVKQEPIDEQPEGKSLTFVNNF